MGVTGTWSPKEVQAAIERLTPSELFELARWFRARYEDEWDRQIEGDALAGRLDCLAREAVAEYVAGETVEFPPREEPND